MSSLWSKTKSAVNNGYGMSGFARIGLPNPFYKPKPWGLPFHPELLEEPPYAQKADNELPPRIHRMYIRGGKTLLKGSKEAKAHMAYLRSLRGRGRSCTTKSRSRKIRGGSDGFFSTLLESLGGTAMNAIKQLALETGASITELLADPKALISKLMTFAPAAARMVKKFFSSKESKPSTPKIDRSKRQEYLRLLKKYAPQEYEKKKLQAMRRTYDNIGIDEDFENGDNDQFDELPTPKQKPSSRAPPISYTNLNI